MTPAEALLYEVKTLANRGVAPSYIFDFIERHELVGGIFIAPDAT